MSCLNLSAQPAKEICVTATKSLFGTEKKSHCEKRHGKMSRPHLNMIDLGLMVEWISDQLPLSPGENGCLAVLHNRNDMVGAFEVQTKAIFRVISFQPLHYLVVAAKRINTLFSLIVFVRVPNAKQPRR